MTSVRRKGTKGDKTLKALSEYSTKEEHQLSTIVYKADGQTFYTRSKIWCLLRGRKYQNSISKQSVILLNVYKIQSAHGMCCMFSTKRGHSTLDRDVVRQGEKLGVGWGAEHSFLSRIQLSLRRHFLPPPWDFVMTFNEWGFLGLLTVSLRNCTSLHIRQGNDREG